MKNYLIPLGGNELLQRVTNKVATPAGIEPASRASETLILSIELRCEKLLFEQYLL